MTKNRVFRTYAALSVAFMAFAAIAPGQSADDGSKAIREVLDQQTAAWNRGDTEAFMAGYWKSDRTEFVGAGGIVRGWDKVHERYQRVYPDAKAMGHLTAGNMQIQMLSPTAAYVVGEYHLVRETGHLDGVYTLIVRKFPEGWRIVHDHTTAYPSDPQHP
ncbi:MAG: DUF4440 domain-containing protein [Candidatus Acidiferrales bacterium]